MVFNASYSNIEACDLRNESNSIIFLLQKLAAKNSFNFFFIEIKSSLLYKVPQDLPACSNGTLSTSPPIYDFPSLEPLDVELAETTKGIERNLGVDELNAEEEVEIEESSDSLVTEDYSLNVGLWTAFLF